MQEKTLEEYYKWQWKTNPSDEPGSFYPQRTNKEIADWWLEKVEKAREEGRKEQSHNCEILVNTTIDTLHTHYQTEIEAIITAYCDIPDYDTNKMVEDLTKLIKH